MHLVNILRIFAFSLVLGHSNFNNMLFHSLSKHGLETTYLFVRVYAVLRTVHARSMNTLYFTIMNEPSNSNVSVQSFDHAI